MEPASLPLSSAEQARIRRERRQAKVSSSAGARLNRITSTQGQTFRKEDETPVPPTQVPARNEPTPDPPEVDISAHHYEPRARQQERLQTENLFANMFSPAPVPGQDLDQPTDLDLRQMLLDMNQGPPPGMGAGGEDPMMAMLQQMMGGAGGMPGMGGMGGPGMQMPPGMGGMMGMPPQQQGNEWGKWWKILHSLCALLLGLWAIRTTGWNFTGSSLQRAESSNLAMSEKPQLFWYFTTMELILQSSRFFLEKGRPPPGSWLTTIGGFLPPPFGSYLTTVARYSVIWTTIIADAGVLLFCLGVSAWWNT